VTIPRVLNFFEADGILVLHDLGKWTEPLESWMYPSTTGSDSPPSPETCRSVGTRLGKILASVHCDATLLLKSQSLTGDGKQWFENPDTKDLVRDEIVGKILPIQRPHFNPDTDRPENIAKLISQDFETSFLNALRSSSNTPKMMFSNGDLWMGSILVGSPPSSTEVELGLIDWEFASPARIGQDIAQLSAWLYLFSTSSTWSSTEPRYRRAVMDTISPASSIGLGQFGPDFGISGGPGAEGAGPETGETLVWRSAAGNILSALLETYAQKVKEYPDYAWFVNETHNTHALRKERLAVIRSIWILFGREVIYNAIEAESCFSKFFPVAGDEKEVEVRMWQRVMIEVGSWYVSRAGESSDEEFEEVVRKESVLREMYTVSRS